MSTTWQWNHNKRYEDIDYHKRMNKNSDLLYQKEMVPNLGDFYSCPNECSAWNLIIYEKWVQKMSTIKTACGHLVL